jgi:hypothetical protein
MCYVLVTCWNVDAPLQKFTIIHANMFWPEVRKKIVSKYGDFSFLFLRKYGLFRGPLLGLQVAEIRQDKGTLIGSCCYCTATVSLCWVFGSKEHCELFGCLGRGGRVSSR